MAWDTIAPSFVRLCPLVRFEVEPRFVVFGALYTVPLSQAWQIFSSLGLFVLLQMLFFVDICMYLVEVSRVSPRLGLGVGSSDSRHAAILNHETAVGAMSRLKVSNGRCCNQARCRSVSSRKLHEGSGKYSSRVAEAELDREIGT